MLLLDDIRIELEGYLPKIDELYEVLAIEKAKSDAERLRELSSAPDFWDDLKNSQKVLSEIKALENKIDCHSKLKSSLEDCLTLIELSDEEGEPDEDTINEITAEANAFKAAYESTKLSTLLSGEYDGNNAIVTFHSGAGGTEAQDWAEMLFRMYTRWGERHNFKVKTLDYLDGDEAGLKSASILIEGLNAYGFLKSEHGVHRLVRISPFDSSGRRHTSFASVEVTPEIPDEADVEINSEDLKIDTYRASGAGGQHINKTESAVRITHLPTGIIVACQTQRSQIQNKDFAMKMLKAKLVEIKEREHLSKIEDIKGVQKDNGWGAQIRSYVFMPYTLAKDHRTNFESGNIGSVMDGDIDGFINAYLVALSHGEI